MRLVSPAVLILVVGLGFAGAASAAPDPVFEKDSHCVAYRARKTMFFVSSNEVVGKNCDVSAQVLPDVGGLYRIEVNIPIKSFQSGDTSRDEDVMQSLKASVRPELTFRTKALTSDQWKDLMRTPEFNLEGELTIGEKTYPLKVVSHFTDTEEGTVDGVAKVRYSDFEIVPPKVGGGVIAKAKPEFELLFQLQGNRILGADSIRPERDLAKAGEKKAEARSKSAVDATEGSKKSSTESSSEDAVNK